jgi:cellulose synthase/poly-beta-1,6-N-acetylglucosamine synthase-like glycosyltransferase
MAFPWDVIDSADLATGQVAEDLKLGLDLARAGTAPVFCPEAVVTSEFPTSMVGAQNQRMRWEQGHIALVASVPKLLLLAVVEANPTLCCLALDVAIPPISLLALLLLLMLVISSLAALFGLSSFPLTLAVLSLLVFAGSLVACWRKHGSEILSASEVLQIPIYLLKKLPIYLTIFLRRSRLQWVRTDRTKSMN